MGPPRGPQRRRHRGTPPCQAAQLRSPRRMDVRNHRRGDRQGASRLVEAAFLFLSAESVATVLALRRHAPTRICLGGLWSGWRRTVAISLAASCTLVMVSCTPTVGDGYTMTQDHWAPSIIVRRVSKDNPYTGIHSPDEPFNNLVAVPDKREIHLYCTENEQQSIDLHIHLMLKYLTTLKTQNNQKK